MPPRDLNERAHIGEEWKGASSLTSLNPLFPKDTPITNVLVT